MLPEIVLVVFVYIGLKRRKYWGFVLNFILLLLNTILMPLNAQISFLWSFPWAIIFWFIPNAIYFYKRKSLFIKKTFEQSVSNTAI
jgi:hypothetical protein